MSEDQNAPQKDIETRLREGSEHCFNCYQAWVGDKKDVEKKQNLEEAVHELRKVASRLEIELATSEGSAGGGKMRAPTHRAVKRRKPKAEDAAE